MITENGFYIMPSLSPELAARLKNKDDWPADVREDYATQRKHFTAAKAEYCLWVRRDRDSRMNRTAKQILVAILDCLNFETGRCDPSHQYLADELGMSVRTVERTIPRIAASGWLTVIRRGRTTTNFYKMTVSTEKVSKILDYVDGLRELRKEEREKRRLYGDPTKVADHSRSDPTFVRSHDPTELADHDPTELAGKHLNRTIEGEHLNEGSCSEVREDTYPREDIPTEEKDFSLWITRNVPDRANHREAYRLLREQKMTPAELRRIAA